MKNTAPTFNENTRKALLNFVLEGFQYEADELYRLATSDFFASFSARFADYRSLLAERRSEAYTIRPISKLASKDRIVDVTSPSKGLQVILKCASLAASCAVFSGWQLQKNTLARNQIRAYIEKYVPAFHGGDPIKAIQLSDKLNGADTIRVIQTLKLMGMLPADTQKCRQLSLGAARGMRDIHSAHLYPVVTMKTTGSILSGKEPSESICFDVNNPLPFDAILVDNNPMYETWYEELNQKEDKNIVGIHLDTYKALDELNKRIQRSECAPRDLVMAFRIDHRMLPDVEDFFCKLGSAIDASADFVLTIGAGHTIKDFQGRLDKIAELKAYLEKVGLEPLQIKWCKGKSVKHKRGNPAFGTASYASFEILYCKLDKELLLDS